MPDQPTKPEPPAPGSLWGVPGKPETYRFVTGTTCSQVGYASTLGPPVYCSLDAWHGWKARVGAVDLTAALSCEQPSAPKGETVRVRAAVVRDQEGGLVVCGYDLGPEVDDAGCIHDANSLLCEHNRTGDVIAWLEADIPLPSVPTVTASVVPAQETTDAQA